ncbi:Rho termination factor N-terminal domain-containing protein [Phaeacidiphilus oryzae]|uniref:Rho termination factor N-terminal domain-containing protein n=1 Tax=Phaeacidiphilus oryzae TaxID=348818 RepID=UPI001F34EA9E|nr:Rho termination factor N-terminal domain-containing protein [Phaeacidiphilus oryzae]
MQKRSGPIRPHKSRTGAKTRTTARPSGRRTSTAAPRAAHRSPSRPAQRTTTRSAMTFDQLYAEAQRRRVPGRSSMRKAELIRALSR